MTELKDNLILIDDDLPIPEDKNSVMVHWSSFNVNNTTFSLPLLVDKWGESLREDYLNWIYQLSIWCTESTSLKLSNQFSLWWGGLLQEKSIYKSPEIYDVFRLRALEKLCEQYQCKKVTLISSNARLHKLMYNFCKNTQRKFISDHVKPVKKWQLTKSMLPFPLRAMLYYLRFIWQRRLFTNSKKRINPNSSSKRNITFISYFPNIDKKQAVEKKFFSRYWEGLHQVIDELDAYITWIFIYAPNTDYTPKEALALTQQFNQQYEGRQQFVFIDELMSITSWLKILGIYFKTYFKTFNLKSILRNFKVCETNLPFYCLWKQAWCSSIKGPVIMDNLIWMEKFTQLAQRLQKQDLTIYLMEGQAWERILTYVWRQHTHKKIYGFAHSVIRFFDLRYYESIKLWSALIERSDIAQYFPDKLIITGKGQEQALLESEFPKETLIKGEAIRYMYLNHVNSQCHLNKKKFLCVTDYSIEATISQLHMLEEAMNLHPVAFENFLIVIKPHPYLPLDTILRLFSFKLSVKVVNSPLSDLWADTSILYSSNGTTASLESVILGIPCIIAQDAKTFNFSPLRKYTDVQFVTTGNELGKALSSLRYPQTSTDYFLLDSSLVEWRSILEVGYEFV